jgi:uracil-DNA glycosylase
MFTGDRSGEFLFAALHRAGLATRAVSVSREDGLELRDAYIVAVIRCAPPQNKPRPDEIARCSTFLDREMALLPNLRVVLALGAIAWRAYFDHLSRTGSAPPRPFPPFAHGGLVEFPFGPALVGSYHVSQQNTQTGKLTPAMFDAVLTLATRCAKADWASKSGGHKR